MNNGEGWYVVIDEDDCVVFAQKFRNIQSRRRTETRVAEALTVGRRYGCGPTLNEAMEMARAPKEMEG